VWLTAVASIPGAADYQRQLDAGTPATEIRTIFDSVALLTSVTTVVSWLVTSRWLVDRVTESGRVRLSPAWARWGWVVPVVSLWYPRQIVGDLVTGGDPDRQQLNLWWLSWIGFSLINNFQAVAAVTATTPINPIRPQFEVAAACLLTASYQVWRRVISAIESSTTTPATTL
jgi:hypothetical protein